MPVGQGVHDEPVKEEELWYVPTGHVIQADPDGYCPMGHVTPQTVFEFAVHAVVTALFAPEHAEHGAQGSKPEVDQVEPAAHDEFETGSERDKAYKV